jgi:phosphatidate cytidylyltransferase
VLRWRIIAAVGILGPLALLTWLDYRFHFGHPGAWLVPAALAFAALATAEMLAMLAAGGHRLLAWPVYAGSLLIVAAACAPIAWEQYPDDCPVGRAGWPLGAVAAALALVLAAEAARFDKPGGSVARAAISLFTVLYVGLPIAFLALLRQWEDNGRGMAALLSVIAVVKVGDMGAYFVGRALGKRKMTPVLSPGKTWEGALAGVATSCLAAWLFFALVAPPLVGAPKAVAWQVAAAYGLVLALAGLVGDLAESMIKRDLGQKDSSRWLVGLGGVLDVVDSLVLAAPAAYLFWAAGWIDL